MCKRCEEIKKKHEDYNYCPYCGSMIRKIGFIPDYDVPHKPFFVEERNGFIVDVG